MNTIAIIGNGYWGSRILKYTDEFFNVKYIANSKFDLNIIWNDYSIEGVIIATPIDTHFDLAKAALCANKHVFVEKPVAMTTKEAVALKACADKYNLKIGVEYTQTFSETIELMQRDLPFIGDVHYVEMATKHLGRFTGYDVYWLLASHHLSIIDIFYPLNTYSSVHFDNQVSYNDMCTTGSIVLDMGCARVRIDVSLEYPGKEMYATFYGENGTLKYTPLEEVTVQTLLFDRVRGNSPSDITSFSSDYKTDERNNLKYAMKYFSDLIEGDVESNIDSAIRITNILEDKK